MGSVHDDQAVTRGVIHALFQSIQAQRIAVAAKVRIGGDEQSETGRQTSMAVGEVAGNIAAGVLSMRHQFMKQELPGLEIKHEQSPARGRDRVIDDRQNVLTTHQSALRGTG